MRKKLIKISAILLVIIFLLPIAIKVLDGCCHHHVFFHCTAKNEVHFHIQHHKCPILTYEFSIFSGNKKIQYVSHYKYHISLTQGCEIKPCCIASAYSFLLRGPPFFINKIKGIAEDA